MAAPSSDPQSLVTARLDKLLVSISTVLASYKALPHAASIYISSLNSFHRQATSLLAQSCDKQGSPPSMEEVERLELEWWACDIVTAWYGPKSINVALNRCEKKLQDTGKRQAGSAATNALSGEMNDRTYKNLDFKMSPVL
ncbi:hypothetical protein L204_100862 [Cryptococcus depauperatus]